LHTVAGMPLLEQAGFKRMVLNFVEKLTYSCATKVYPNSFKLRDIIIKNEYCPPTKLKVLANGSSNGIDTSYFDATHFSEDQKSSLKQELGIKSSDFVFIFVGRIVSDKGINELISAFSEIQEIKTDLKLLLVGPYEQELDPLKEETLNQINGNKSIIALGYQNEVRPYFAISDCLVFPSYREGFPNVVMQAGAMGLPCIVSDINGCNEIIEDTKNGYIIPVRDKEAVKETLIRILDNKEEYSKMQQNAREMIVSRFDQKTMWESILQEYRNFEAK
jgi:glycosyltransferase involved in cell wall biosynthesis